MQLLPDKYLITRAVLPEKSQKSFKKSSVGNYKVQDARNQWNDISSDRYQMMYSLLLIILVLFSSDSYNPESVLAKRNQNFHWIHRDNE